MTGNGDVINDAINEHTMPLQRQNQHNNSNEQVEWISRFLTDCPEAAENVQKYLQKNYQNKNKIKINEPSSSTPKRSHPLDESGGSVNYGSGRQRHQRKRFQQSQENEIDINDSRYSARDRQPLMEVATHTQQVTTESFNHHKRIPFEQLKHAVSSNLPCFYIQWNPDSDRKKIPSAIHASELLIKELKSNGVDFNGFTLVGWAGKRLKLGVNNKVDYATLAASDKWPTKINEIDIEVIKPKYTPDAFILVVRYVPQELDEEFVANEIQRTIASASHVKRIRFSYQRKLNDYKFEVKDYQEYQSVLKLGRIAIGYSWLSITPFYPGNRLTYCTKCWCLGHLRNNCNSTTKCRICLEPFTANSPHSCSKEPKCAQCEGNHHSLDNRCHVICDYKERLKEEVKEAINSGKLRRMVPAEQVSSFKLQEQDFPALSSNIIAQQNKWITGQSLSSHTNTTTATIPALESVKNNLVVIMDSNKRIEEKFDQFKTELNVVTLDTQLHQAVLFDVVEIMKDFIDKFVPPSLTYSKNDRISLMPLAQQCYERLSYAATTLNNGFKCNRKMSRTTASSLTTATVNRR